MARINFPKWTSSGRTLLCDGKSIFTIDCGGNDFLEATTFAQHIAALFHEDERRRAVQAAHPVPGQVAWATHKEEDPEQPILFDLVGVPGLTVTISLGPRVADRLLLGALQGLLDHFTKQIQTPRRN